MKRLERSKVLAALVEIAFSLLLICGAQRSSSLLRDVRNHSSTCQYRRYTAMEEEKVGVAFFPVGAG